MAGLQQTFADGPAGGTPLLGTLQQIFNAYAPTANQKSRQLLVVVITDGEPSDGSRDDLFSVLYFKPQNVHVSFAECTDNEEDMKYLDEWDGRIPKFDNTGLQFIHNSFQPIFNVFLFVHLQTITVKSWRASNRLRASPSSLITPVQSSNNNYLCI